MAILIDTSILIAHERQHLNIAPYIADRHSETFFLSVISASELLHGAHRANDAVIGARRMAFVEAVLVQFPLIEIDLVVARAHARLWSELARKGEMIGVHDSWIAASCVAHDLTLVTANLREFRRVPGLRIELWMQA